MSSTTADFSSTQSLPPSSSHIQGWETLFGEIDSFVLASGHQIGQCTKSYAYHTLERLEVFVTTVTRLADHLETNVGQTSVEHRATVLGYASQARELIGYLRSLTGEWQSYIDTIENQGNYEIPSISFSARQRTSTLQRATGVQWILSYSTPRLSELENLNPTIEINFMCQQKMAASTGGSPQKAGKKRNRVVGNKYPQNITMTFCYKIMSIDTVMKPENKYQHNSI